MTQHQWFLRARCHGVGPGPFFLPVGETGGADAKALCSDCVVHDDCLSYALGQPHLSGIWGGTTPLERERLRRQKDLRL